MAGSDKETRRVDSGRNSNQSSNKVSEASSGKTKSELKQQDADWGYEPAKGGMAVEAKMGMGIIVILVAAFGFLVYHKFDLRQRQLLAANMKAGSTDGEADTLKQAVEGQVNSFNEFGSSATDTLATTAQDAAAVTAVEGQPLPKSAESNPFVDRATESTVAATDSAVLDRLQSSADVFPKLTEPQPAAEPTSFQASVNAATPTISDFPPEASADRKQEDAFPAFAANDNNSGGFGDGDTFSDATESSTPGTPSMPREDFPPANLFPEENQIAGAQVGKALPTDDTPDPFPTFDANESVSVSPEPPALSNDANAVVSDESSQSNTVADQRFARSFDSLEEPKLLPHVPEPAFQPTEVASADTSRDLPFAAGSTETNATSVSQANPVETAKNSQPDAAQPDLFPEFAPNESSTGDTVAELPAASEIPLLTDVEATEGSGQSNAVIPKADVTPTSNPFAEPKPDLHNVIAMLEPSPDVNLFEEPMQRDEKPPRTFPSAAETAPPVAVEPEMPSFPGFDTEPRTFTAQPKIENFPTANDPPETLTPPATTNLFPQTAEPHQRVAQTESPTLVPEPREPAFAKPASPGAIDMTPSQQTPTLPLSVRPYEPEEPRQQTEQWGPDVGIAHIMQADDILLTSGSSGECAICEVRPKDTYWTISKRAYGTARYFSSLALYNKHRIPDPKKLRPGMKVLVPDPSVLEKKYPEFFPKAKPTTRTLPNGYFVTKDGKPAYRVGARETLSEISHKHLGRASRWIQIYQMNRQTLRDPNRLKPGTVIMLPDDATNVQLAP